MKVTNIRVFIDIIPKDNTIRYLISIYKRRLKVFGFADNATTKLYLPIIHLEMRELRTIKRPHWPFLLINYFCNCLA